MLSVSEQIIAHLCKKGLAGTLSGIDPTTSQHMTSWGAGPTTEISLTPVLVGVYYISVMDRYIEPHSQTF